MSRLKLPSAAFTRGGDTAYAEVRRGNGIVDFSRYRVRGCLRGRGDWTGIAARVAGELYDGRPQGHDRRCRRVDDASSRARARFVDLDGLRRVFDPEGFRPDARDHRSEARRSFSGLRAGGGGGPE